MESRSQGAGFRFTQAPRSAYKSLYRGKSEQNYGGNDSPGPVYAVQDNPLFRTAPKFTIAKAERKRQIPDKKTLNSTFDFSLFSSESKRNLPGCHFGKSSKMPSFNVTESPGPKYFPVVKPGEKSSPKYTLGIRRSQNASFTLGSTTEIVGPGRYHSDYTVTKSHPVFTIPRNIRETVMVKNTGRNATIAGQISACGDQVVSKKKTAPKYGFGKCTREQMRAVGLVRAEGDQRERRVRLE